MMPIKIININIKQKKTFPEILSGNNKNVEKNFKQKVQANTKINKKKYLVYMKAEDCRTIYKTKQKMEKKKFEGNKQTVQNRKRNERRKTKNGDKKNVLIHK